MVCGKWIYMRLLFQERPLSLSPACLSRERGGKRAVRSHKPCLRYEGRKNAFVFLSLCVIFYYVTRNNWNKSSHQTSSILYHYVEGAGRIKWKQAGAFCLFSLRFPSFFLLAHRPPRSTFILLPFLLFSSSCSFTCFSVLPGTLLFSHGTTSFLQNEGKRLFTASAMYRDHCWACARCRRRHHDSLCVLGTPEEKFLFPSL